MRALVSGQIGMDKKPYLEAVAELAGARGGRIETFHIGDLMYAEAPDIRPGRILDLPLSRLNALRRAVFRSRRSTTACTPSTTSTPRSRTAWCGARRRSWPRS
ncbi:MAG: hypothetical protein ACYS1B_16170 [Planctomycetota bacterium]|jgi:hypothetical protein